MSTLNIQLLCRNRNFLNYPYLLPDLVPWLTLSDSNYPYLEQFSMVPKMFEPLRFDCILKCFLSSVHVIYIYFIRSGINKKNPNAYSIQKQMIRLFSHSCAVLHFRGHSQSKLHRKIKALRVLFGGGWGGGVPEIILVSVWLELSPRIEDLFGTR